MTCAAHSCDGATPAVLRLVATFVWLFLVMPPAVAQIGGTIFGGYSFSEGLDNQVTGERAHVSSAASFGIAVDYNLDAGRELQLFYGQQSTTIDPGAGGPRFDMDVRYLHIGGTYFFDGPIGRGPYAVGGLGVTHLSPSLGGLSSETRASMNVGFGYLVPLSSTVGLRAEARAFLTLLNSSTALFCSGGCVVLLSGDGFFQGYAMLGLSVKF
jgi:hypothetical protein